VDQDRSRSILSPRVARVVRWGLVAWSLIGVLILGYLLYRYALRPVRIVIAPLLVAMVVVYLLNPIVSRMTVRGIPRGLATILTYVVFLGIMALGLRFLIPVIAHQVSGFAKTVPDLLDRAQVSLTNTLRRLGAKNVRTNEIFKSFSPTGDAGSFISRIFSLTQSVLHILVVWLLGMVLAAYLLIDLPKIQRGAMSLLPQARRQEVRSVLEQIGAALGGFFRGQLLVALFVGLASMLGLYIVGLPYWALVGAIAGLTNLVPLIGPIIGAILALFVAFTTGASEGLMHLHPGWPLALGSGVSLLIVRLVDDYLISPNIVAKTVKLHPVTVMLGLLVGGTLVGLPGMLLAVPTIAAIKIVLLHYWDTRMQWPPRREDGQPGLGGGEPEIESEEKPSIPEDRRLSPTGADRTRSA
jgi:predicted PurR-regulated permease PerM